MVKSEAKKFLKRVYTNLSGWGTNRKIVVIESDDWGSIRMPSKGVFNTLLKAGYPVDRNPYERNDSLASEEDLNLLFDLLMSFRDKNKRHPIITANCVVANPDFQQIEASNFGKYHFEIVTETFKKYPNHSRNFDLWLEAKLNNVFLPQYHAREHLNVSKYMNALRNSDRDVLFAFNKQMLGALKKNSSYSGNDFVESTNYADAKDKAEKIENYLQGLLIFKDLFGYSSRSIIPTNYIWSGTYNQSTSQLGVEYIQGASKMKEPVAEGFKLHKRKLGELNNEKQISMVRNCFFEPSLSGKNNQHLDCLRDIEIAFKMKKPAIISSHRVNYVGYLNEKNRDHTLFEFKKLLQSLLIKHPAVEFMSSVELGDIIKQSKGLID